MIEKVGSLDSPVEGTGFELSVPLEKDWPNETIIIDLGPLLVCGKK